VEAEEQVPVGVGHSAPDFLARDMEGKPVRLMKLIGGRMTLLVFYRGGWCPFCNQQLAAIAQDYPKFDELGATVVVVSSEEVEKGRDLLQKLKPPFRILSDTRFEGIDAYGVRDTNPSPGALSRGVTALSRPAAFIIDEAGIVRYKYVGKSAPDRPKNEDILQALGEMVGRSATSGPCAVF
jgi:peroxiredoxin